MSRIPAYSNKAKENMGIFYQSYQDFQFYIEDEKQITSYLYKEVLSKVLGVKLKRVFPLGNRQKVIDASKLNRLDSHFFIIDKDLDPYLDSYKEDDYTNVIQLERYCIENYYIEEQTFYDALNYLITEEEINGTYLQWLDSVLEDFREVFRYALIARKYNVKEWLNGQEYKHLKSNNDYLVDRDNIRKKFTQRLTEQSIVIDLDEELRKVEDIVSNLDPKNELVSGKFLFTSLKVFIKKLAQFYKLGGIRDDTIELQLINHIDCSNFSFIRDYVYGTKTEGNPVK
ncbi:hypothetical protein CHH49_04000 [Terribacillus saccharophilus]|uniref:DUF4435 domain-containing protein n=1 Tax=Terribacillus saccharophilus TaxID=361277 RepID=UPI000BA666F6|nr:DUF4435 domain-containing protein [Terribacillus saccharophilus]PAF22757.1 hypothetical protein CHH49_04000 [Terribacillus saccharophilus]